MFTLSFHINFFLFLFFIKVCHFKGQRPLQAQVSEWAAQPLKSLFAALSCKQVFDLRVAAELSSRDHHCQALFRELFPVSIHFEKHHHP